MRPQNLQRLDVLTEALDHIIDLQAQYDRLLHRCRYAEGVVRDLHGRCEVAAKSLGDGK